MKSRDWLVSKGLAKKSRGRISNEAKAALAQAIAEGMVFSDISSTDVKAPIKVSKKQSAPAVISREKVREQKVVWGIDRGKKQGQKDIIIAFDTCSCHGRSIQYCTSPVPKLPKWIDSQTYMEHP